MRAALPDASGGAPVRAHGRGRGSACSRALKSAWARAAARKSALLSSGSCAWRGKRRRTLRGCARALGEGFSPDVVAPDMLRACELLDNVTGRDASEEVISAIFANFCVGT